MAKILLISKPIAPPWNDSGKNLVRDLARGLTCHQPTLMVRRSSLPDIRGASYARVYGGQVGFAPGAIDQARVFAYLCASRGHALWHFFFAPNPRSCRAGGFCSRVRRMPTVHTLSSAPRDSRTIVPWLFADINVVLSEHTERSLLAAGLSPSRLRRIAPAIAPLAPKAAEERAYLRISFGLPQSAPLVVFPGDLEFGEGANLMLELARGLHRDVRVVMACRAKTPRARAAQTTLTERVRTLGLSEQVRFVGETARIHELLACADVVALPSVDLYAKMDYPLVVLEAMSLARAVVVAEGSAAAELGPDGVCVVRAEAEALTHQVARLLDDSAASNALGDHARSSVLARYTYPMMSRAYEQLYSELLA